MRIWIMLVLSLVFCHHGAAADELTFLATEELPGPPALREAVDQLSPYTTVTSGAVGAAGSPSGIFRIAQEMLDAAPVDTLVSLAFHQSPVVRAYTVAHIVSEYPELSIQLTPLLSDHTRFKTQMGCVGGTEDVSEWLVSRLCWQARAHAGPRKVIQEAAGRPGLGMSSHRALQCLEQVDPMGARQIAEALLSGEEPAALVQAIRTLSLSPHADIQQQIAALTRHAHKDVRKAAAAGMGITWLDTATDVLAPMLADPSVEVQEAVAHSLASVGTEEALGLLLQWLMEDRGRLGSARILEPLMAQRSHAASTFMIALLSMDSSRSMKGEALEYLAQTADRRGIPATREALHGGLETEASARTLMILGDMEWLPYLGGFYEGSRSSGGLHLGWEIAEAYRQQALAEGRELPRSYR